ncbi:hypothetical protein SARC_08602 [Sphaeroforma arctica JP610]|uniref:Uncharacterized protein n=1 Tax=Sphaeroforma arctica JP610 TaxID=667725 RepID=A0A0L0FQC9_9EUKA|nr:hypothetical protein SARC_08602 [Sphaeroforma arctica JP610]KNC78987.1 hypothetical protein SARC_08602 [Sphaeroforma arctica JP610]|eukprot:XP_014152889.1 hypothetical protein SARC_08602 [Sphaeroforma arctica JP610]
MGVGSTTFGVVAGDVVVVAGDVVVVAVVVSMDGEVTRRGVVLRYRDWRQGGARDGSRAVPESENSVRGGMVRTGSSLGMS